MATFNLIVNVLLLQMPNNSLIKCSATTNTTNCDCDKSQYLKILRGHDGTPGRDGRDGKDGQRGLLKIEDLKK